ncbi:MAG: extracellular solute-binding protein [Treponema sp.]|nr:extracellular solute-binding protein [Treponema sp.]
MKRIFALFSVFVFLAVVTGVTGCSGKRVQKEQGPVTLSFYSNMTDVQADLQQKLSSEWSTATGNKIEYSAPGSSYEELLKTKMAANELPDLFTTHGWSVMRYSEYLMPVNDLPWAENINPQIKPVITDKNGKMYVLPMDVDIAGIVYNVDVLKKAGVNVDDIKTWNDFDKACAKIKASGVVPVHMGGKDNWTIGQFFDWAAPSYFVTNPADNERDNLKNGKFNTQRWEELSQLLADFVAKGYFNQDVLTADYLSDQQAIAAGKAAFGFYGNYFYNSAMQYNKDASLGMMPIPSRSADDEPSLISGERTAVGVWKDSPHLKEAVDFLNFLAKPENVKQVASLSGTPAGLVGVTAEMGNLKQYYDKYTAVKTYPYFDREYLPSGMWDVMCSTGADILAGKPSAVKNAAKVMEQNFNDKYTK